MATSKVNDKSPKAEIWEADRCAWTRKGREGEAGSEQRATEREAILAEGETALAERERRADEVTKQVDEVPVRLEATTKTAREEVAKNLKAEHAIETKDT